MKKLNILLFALLTIALYPLYSNADAYPEDITPPAAGSARPFAAPYLTGEEITQQNENSTNENSNITEGNPEFSDIRYAENEIILPETFASFDIYSANENSDEDFTLQMNNTRSGESGNEDGDTDDIVISDSVSPVDNTLPQNQETVSLNEYNTGIVAEGIMPFSESDNPSTGMPEFTGILITAIIAIGAAPVLHVRKK